MTKVTSKDIINMARAFNKEIVFCNGWKYDGQDFGKAIGINTGIYGTNFKAYHYENKILVLLMRTFRGISNKTFVEPCV